MDESFYVDHQEAGRVHHRQLPDGHPLECRSKFYVHVGQNVKGQSPPLLITIINNENKLFYLQVRANPPIRFAEWRGHWATDIPLISLSSRWSMGNHSTPRAFLIHNVNLCPCRYPWVKRGYYYKASCSMTQVLRPAP